VSGNRQLSILIVDDEAIGRRALRSALAATGFDTQVDEVQSVAEARYKLSIRPYDCAVVDYDLGGGSGREVLEAARAGSVHTPVVMLTGHGDEALAVELMKAGARDYLPKAGLSPERLGQSLRYVLAVQAAEQRAMQAIALTAGQNRVLERVARGAPLGGVLEDIVRLVERQAEPTVACILRLAESRSLELAAAPNLAEEPRRVLRRVPFGQLGGALGTSAELGRSVFSSTLDSDPVCERLQTAGAAIGACWATPILTAPGELLGIVALLPREAGQPDPNHRALLGAAAHLAGIAIDTKRAEDALKEEARLIGMLHRIGSTLASELDSRKLVQIMTEEATAMVGAELGAFFSKRESGSDQGAAFALQALAGAGRDAFAELPRPRATQLFTATLDGQIVRLDDVTDSPLFGRLAPHHGPPPGHPAVRSYLAVPLVSRMGTVLGGLYFAHRTAGVFHERHERIAVGIAGWASVALDNARLLEAERTARAEAESAVRLRDDIVAIVSHDLRNPLEVIVTGCALLRELPDQKRESRLAAIERGAARMTSLINDLLDVTRVESGKLLLAQAPVEPAEVIDEVCELLRPLAIERKLELLVELDVSAAPVYADHGRVLQVLQNLIGNALKFTPETGRIVVAATLDEAAVRFSVSDTGSGIEPDQLAHVFDRFWQASRGMRAGAGLGLAIARGIVLAHGGRIWAESRVGHGTRFCFTLPLARQVARESPDRVRSV
jgi:signal transduction histidine kinase/DNA-binding NarL/FixJ family response regulator